MSRKLVGDDEISVNLSCHLVVGSRLENGIALGNGIDSLVQ